MPVLFLYLLFPLVFTKSDAYALPKPALYDLERLAEVKEKGKNDSLVCVLLKSADGYVDRHPLTVIGKEFSYSQNPHDYCSIAPYSWPNDKNPKGPYVTRDGIINPERNKYDFPKLSKLADRIQVLSVAFYITEDVRYYDAIINNLNSWFINKATYMEPNFSYAQVVKGRNNNLGQPYGLVDMKKLTPIIESVLLVNMVKKLDETLVCELRSWFSLLLSWVIDSQQWSSLTAARGNNIMSSCYVVLAEMARFTCKKDFLEQLASDYSEQVLNSQIDDEGKQPAELRRTNAFGYSVGNLSNIVDFCLIMESGGVPYYKINQKKIDSAFEYLLHFVGNHEEFPYLQIHSWHGYEVTLQWNVGRMKRVKSIDRIEANSPIVVKEIKSDSILNYVY